MEDNCFVCYVNLASVTLCNCQHRFLCPDCLRRIRESAHQNGSRPQCPVCRSRLSKTDDSTALQLRPVTIKDGEKAMGLHESYPYGSLLFIGSRTRLAVATEDLVVTVREAMHAVQASLLSYDQLEMALADRLTRTQHQLVFAELIKEVDLHDILRKVDERRFATESVMHAVRTLVKHTVEGIDDRAVALRAVVGTAGTSATALTIGTSGITQFNFTVNGISNVFMFTLFSAVEIYRWSRGDIEASDCAVNIGEHATGALAGYGGAYGGALLGGMAGAALGSVVPGIGTIVGGLIGSIIGMFSLGVVADALGRWTYRKFTPKRAAGFRVVEEQEEHEERLSPIHIATAAAERLDIDLSHHNYREAFARYRTQLLLVHPDKAVDAEGEEKERLQACTRDVMACWVIVREHYKYRGMVESAAVDECTIMLHVLKVYEAATNQWMYARCWFGNLGLGRPVDPYKERIDEMMVYI